jgi:hypothetical protein
MAEVGVRVFTAGSDTPNVAVGTGRVGVTAGGVAVTTTVIVLTGNKSQPLANKPRQTIKVKWITRYIGFLLEINSNQTDQMNLSLLQRRVTLLSF